MRAEYKRDLNHNYLILHQEQEIDTSSYQVRMLVGNAVPSILQCRVQQVDGECMICFDITSRQSAATLFEEKKIGYTDLQLIFGGFVKAMEEMGEYLLNPGRLILRPEYIYVDAEKKTLSFCYLPGFEADVRRQFQELAEYILPKLDHEDERAVMLGYGVYRRALEDSFHLEHIKEELYRDRKEEDVSLAAARYRKDMHPQKKEESLSLEQENKDPISGSGQEKGVAPDDQAGKAPVSTEWNRPEYDGGGKKARAWTKILGCVTAAAAGMGVLAAKTLGWLPGLPLEVVLGVILGMMAAGMAGYAVMTRIKRRRKPEKKTAPDGSPPEEKPEEKRKEKKAKKRYPEEKYPKGKCPKDRFSKEKYPEENQWEEKLWEEQSREEKAWEEKAREENRLQEPEKEEGGADYGETVLLSEAIAVGPASLVSREPGELATIYLQEELTVIGKLENAADAVIDRPTVSRIHAKIRRREENYYLTDLNSRNGTSVNGQMLRPDEEYCLQDQDEVDFAQARYVFIK